MSILFWICAILIVYPLILYPLSLAVISIFFKEKPPICYEEGEYPTISIIVAAYNEEKVIEQKLQNLCDLEYPRESMEIIIASDDSNDRTHELVQAFIEKHPETVIRLMVIKGRVGKTSVQNRATAEAKGEICLYSDANSMWDVKAAKALVRRFKDPKMGYVSGRLQYNNRESSKTSDTESKYWNFDLWIRKKESSINNTVGGNGAIYAIRKSFYVDLAPIISHDGFMPTKMVIRGAKAKYVEDAVCYEKASEDSGDEFARKVRMQRGQPFKKYLDFRKFNVFRYGWFSYFYFGHKYLKYILYVLHPLLYIVNAFLIFNNLFYLATFVLQTLFYLFALMGLLTRKTAKIRIFHYPYHYCMTIVAQFVSVIKTLTGKTRATWEQSKTTRQ